MKLNDNIENLEEMLFYVIRQDNNHYSILKDPTYSKVLIVDPAEIYNTNGEALVVELTKYRLISAVHNQKDYYLLDSLIDVVLDNKIDNTNFYFVGLRFYDIKLKETIKQELVKGNKKYIEYCINWFKKSDLLKPESKGCYSIRKVIDYIDQDISDRTDSQEDYDKIMDKEVIAKLKTYKKLKQGNSIETAPVSELADIRKLLQYYNNPIVEEATSNPIVLKQ